MLFNSKVQGKGLKNYIKHWPQFIYFVGEQNCLFYRGEWSPFFLVDRDRIVISISTAIRTGFTKVNSTWSSYYQAPFSSIQLLPSSIQPHYSLLATCYVQGTMKISKMSKTCPLFSIWKRSKKDYL